MATKRTGTLALFLALNLLFSSLATAAGCCQSCPSATPKPKPKPTLTLSTNCHMDAQNLSLCTDLLGGLLNKTTDIPPKEPCCSLLDDLLDLDAAVCLCAANKADVLDLRLNIPLSIRLLLNVCGKKVPSSCKCG